MPTVFGHGVAALAIGAAFPRRALPGRVLPAGAWIAGAACAVLPDLDTIGFRLGVPYGAMLGHRGLSHSLLFAAAAGAIAALLLRRAGPQRVRRIPMLALWGFLALCTASHGVLDALTDGGHGVAFFAPFSDARFFLPWQPIEVSPLGWRRFLGPRGLEVLASETFWIGLPAAVALAARRFARRGDAPTIPSVSEMD